MAEDSWKITLSNRKYWTKCEELSPTGHKCQLSHYHGPDIIKDVMGNKLDGRHSARFYDSQNCRFVTEEW